MTQGGQKSIGYEAVWDKTESTINTPDAVGFKDSLLYHDRLAVFYSGQIYIETSVNVDHILKSPKGIIVLFVLYLRVVDSLTPLENVSRVVVPNTQ
ncbi:unnamed protein product [marine sediment metagenome]|uniref:Uncharacterized protein n=1 Tax=marine sediment metagenome TaxID=412755 RepID=X0WYP0_9ZZZZ